MADIFLSYANEDRDRAAQVAALLESAGWIVWWDRRIPAGRTWRAVLEEALVGARCMIVLWSHNSVDSPWVAEEAEEARRQGKTLVPVLIQRVEPPMGFRAIQAADLAKWDGSGDDSAVQQLVADLKSLLGTPHDEEKHAAPAEVHSRPKIGTGVVLPWYLAHWPKAVLAVFAVAVLAVLWKNWPSVQTDAPVPPVENKRVEVVSAPRLTLLSVIGTEKSIEPSQTLKLTATAKYSDGSEGDVTDSIQWSSSNMRVATVDEQGVVKALQTGTTKIKARIGDVESSEWTLGVAGAKPAIQPVAAPALVGLSVSASRLDLFEKEKIALRAKGRYSDDSEKSLARGIEWQISDRTIASVNTNGELVALRPGKIEVVARADQLKSAPLAFSIKEARKLVEPPKIVKSAEGPAIKLPAVAEQTKARIVAYIHRAESLREEGNYAAALAELEKAKAIDATNEEIRKEIEQTKRACNAEKVLGNKPNC